MAAEDQSSEEVSLSVGREVRRTMAQAATNSARRLRLVHILAFAQFLVAIAAVPGYLDPQPHVGPLTALGAAAGVSVLAYLTSRATNQVAPAAYILVGGSACVTFANMLVAALSGDVRATAQAALFLLPVIFAAGVLFTAEVIVLLLVLAMSLTAAALFFALAQGAVVPVSEIYVMMVSSLGLQALLGYIAWLVAQFLQERGNEVQRTDQMRFSRLQVESLQQQQERQQTRTHKEIAVLQDAIARLMAGASVTGVPVVPGELADLMKSFNLLLDHLRTHGTARHGASTDEVAGQMLELIGQISDGATSVSSLAAQEFDSATNGTLGMAMQALVHLQTRSAHRNARLQELLGDVTGAVQTGLDGLGNTSTDLQTATRLAGRLVAAANQLLPALKASHALVVRARDRVGALLPPALVQAAAADAVHRDAANLTPDEAARLLGRYDDLEGIDILDVVPTGEFEALLANTDPTLGAPDPAIPPLMAQIPTLSGDTSGSGRRAHAPDWAPGGGSDEERQAYLLELWRTLDRLVATLATEYRTLQSLSRDLGKLSRSVRNVDAGVVHGVASMDAASAALKDLHDHARPNRAPAVPPYTAPTTSAGSYAAPPAPDAAPGAPPDPSHTSRPIQQGHEPLPAPDMGTGMGTDRGTQSDLGPAPGSLSAADLFADDAPIGQIDVNQLIDPDLRDGPSNPSGSGQR